MVYVIRRVGTRNEIASGGIYCCTGFAHVQLLVKFITCNMSIVGLLLLFQTHIV